MNILRTCKVLLLAIVAPAAALADGSCSVTSVTLSAITYENAAVTSTGTVNYNCTRTKTSDGETTVNFNASPGQFPATGTRQAGNGGNRVAYSLATTAAWGDGTSGLGNPHIVVTQFAKGNVDTFSGSFPFTFSMAASLNPVTGITYADTVAITGTCTNTKGTLCAVTGNTLAISIHAPTSCSISTAPGTLNLSYTSFQATPGVGNVTFAATCSNGGPYRMSLNPTTGTLLGVNYGLTLGTSAGSTVDISSTTTYNLTGTGGPAAYFINARAVSGQSGTCAMGTCSAISTPHTLTIEY